MGFWTISTSSLVDYLKSGFFKTRYVLLSRQGRIVCCCSLAIFTNPLEYILQGSSLAGESEPSSPAAAENSDQDDEMSRPLADLLTATKSPEAEPPLIPSANSLLALLGNTSPQKIGPEVHSDVAALLSTFLLKGLPKEMRKSTLDDYPPLKGCLALQPPEINSEIKSCLRPATLRQDGYLLKLQLKLASGLSALALPFNAQYEEVRTTQTPESQAALEKLGDPLKLFADAYHSLSLHRRYLIVPDLDTSVKDILEDCPIDALLFGTTFPEKLKTSKETKRLGASLKKKPKMFLTRQTPTPAVTGTSVPSSSSRPPVYSSRRHLPGRGPSTSLNSQRYLPKNRYKKEEGKRIQRRPYQH